MYRGGGDRPASQDAGHFYGRPAARRNAACALPLHDRAGAGWFSIRPVSIPQTFIQELLSRVDVVDIVGRYVQLRKGGANFMGLCPFHGEKSPSFSVSPSKQFYHC